MENKKLLAGVSGILVGYLGIHKFILGYNKEGVIYLAANFIFVPIISFITCGSASFLFAINLIPIIEGIIYLTKSDEEFIRTYQENKKPWF
jgi:TM2 domain-containing membrane protein YozV